MVSSSQKMSVSASWSWWTASLVIGGSVIVGIFLVGFVLVSWQSLQRMSFTALNDDKKISTSMTDQTPDQDQKIVLDDTVKKILDDFGIYDIKPWMLQSVELFESPGRNLDHVKYLMIRGSVEEGEKVLIYGSSPYGGRPEVSFEEIFDTCSGASATSTEGYFVVDSYHSPCEAFVEREEIYYRWSGERVMTINRHSDNPSFSFYGSDILGGEVKVGLTFSKGCPSPMDDLSMRQGDEEVILKTSITGINVNNIFHKLPRPLEVSCAMGYGGMIWYPHIGYHNFDAEMITFNLTDELPKAFASIDVKNWEKVTFDLQ